MKSVLMERNGKRADVHPDEVSSFAATGWVLVERSKSDDDDDDDDDGDDETDTDALQLFVDFLSSLDDKPKISEVFAATGVKVSGKQITRGWRDLEAARQAETEAAAGTE